MTKEEILAACRKFYDLYSDDCSGFIRAVARELGYTLTGNADDLVSELERRWTTIDRAQAIEAAAAGTLVIVGLKAADHNPPRRHGHIAVVVDGPLYHGKYPRVWCGSIGGSAGQSEGNKSVGEVWRRTDRDNVSYFKPSGG
jgi:cell wall-associated NlpC family hydrolase